MRAPLIALLTLAFAVSAHAQQREPRFADYPVSVYRGPIAQEAVIDDKIDDDIRLKLSDHFTERTKVTAAGHYILVLWSCGSSCVDSGFVDARDGSVVWPPFNISGWRRVYGDFSGVVAKPNSKLVVFQGARNEEGIIGRHYYVLDNGTLTHLRSVDTKGNFRSKPR